MILHDALRVEKLPFVQGDQHIYRASISKAWCIGGIPHGGYVVGIILSATNELQSRSPHPDPVHLTAHYLQPVDIEECEIRARVIRSGRKFTNIDADLIQNGNTKITSRIIYGVLPDLSQVSSSTADSLTLTPSSPYGRQIPLSQHPSLVTPDKPNDKYLYQIKAEDRYFEEQNAARAERQANGKSNPISDCGMEWGAWLELNDPAGKLESAMIPLFADLMKNLPSLLPRERRPGPSWFATVVLTVEFKSRIPSCMSDPKTTHTLFSPRTVGIYASSRFMTEGRHDEFVEIWTAPSTIGGCSLDSGQTARRELDPQWRQKQICLAISTQMALTIPEENSRRSRL